MFCKHCGSKIDDGVAFCHSCGKPQGDGTAQAVAAGTGIGESYFDGGAFQHLGWEILGALVTVVTLGICYPFAVNWLYAWEAEHTVIEGRRLKFTGSAGGLFGTWILCLLLTVVTLGIYYFWVPLKIKKWREANTFFEDDVPTFSAEQRLRKEKASRFDGGLLQYIGWNILGVLVTVFTLGICYPWAVQMVYSWEQRHKVYCGRRCTFDGKAVGLFGTWVVCLLLSIVTLGFYLIWVPIRIQRWKVKHTHLLADDTSAEEQENKNLTPEKLAARHQEGEKLAKRLNIIGSAFIIVGWVLYNIPIIIHGDIRLTWPQCFLLLCAVGLLALNWVRFKNRSVVQLILTIAALVLLLPTVLWIPHNLFGIVAYLRYGNFLFVVRGISRLLFELLPLAGVVVSFVGWLKERRAATEVAGDAAGE